MPSRYSLITLSSPCHTDMTAHVALLSHATLPSAMQETGLSDPSAAWIISPTVHSEGDLERRYPPFFPPFDSRISETPGIVTICASEKTFF